MKKPERKEKICIVLIGAPIIYENGAEVITSFVTNMDSYAVRIEPGLRATIEEISKKLQQRTVKELPQYSYPMEILTGKDYRLAKYGKTLRIRHKDCVAVDALDAQKARGKSIFGSGLLLSERAAAERAAAERAAAERAAAERAAAERKVKIQWELSAREWEIVKKLDR